jgi:hypothetical protein
MHHTDQSEVQFTILETSVYCKFGFWFFPAGMKYECKSQDKNNETVA